MFRHKILPLLIAVVFSLSSTVFARSRLTVDDVVKMARSGLSESVIEATIKSSGRKFRLNDDDISRLRRAGVSDHTMDLMAGDTRQSRRTAAERRDRDRARAKQDRLDRERDRRRRALLRKAEDAEKREKRLEARDRRKLTKRELRIVEERRRRREEAARKEAEERKLAAEKRARDEARRKEDETRNREEARKRDEAQRIRLAKERERLARERFQERSKREAEQNARLKAKYAPFNQGRVLEDKEQFFPAANAYFTFLTKNATPNSQEYSDAQYFIARSLFNGGMLAGALQYLEPILSRGPSDLNFARSAQMFMVVARELSYEDNELFQKVAKLDLKALPRDVQDAINYLVAKFFYHWGNYRRAKRLLSLVSPDSPYYSSGMYLMGLLNLQERKEKKTKSLKEAHDAFVKSVLAAEKRPEDDARILDLGYLALARLAYEVGQLDGALFYYRKISHESPQLGQAFFEKAWTYFLKGQYSHAIGAFHALHSPYFKEQFLPDLYVVEATVYLNSCQYVNAKELAELFQKKYGSLKDLISNLVKQNLPMEKYYEMFLNAGTGKPSPLPRSLYNLLLADTDFYYLFSTIQELEKEEGKLARAMAQTKEREIWLRIQNRIKSQLRDYTRRAGKAVWLKLQDAATELDLMLVKSDEIIFDSINAEKEQLDEEATRMLRGQQPGAKAPLPVAKKRAPIDWSKMYWKFQNEYWEDELEYYRGLHTDRCRGGQK